MSFIISIIVGGIAGWLAGQIMGSRFSVLGNIIIGVIGGFVGSTVLETCRNLKLWDDRKYHCGGDRSVHLHCRYENDQVMRLSIHSAWTQQT